MLYSKACAIRIDNTNSRRSLAENLTLVFLYTVQMYQGPAYTNTGPMDFIFVRDLVQLLG